MQRTGRETSSLGSRRCCCPVGDDAAGGWDEVAPAPSRRGPGVAHGRKDRPPPLPEVSLTPRIHNLEGVGRANID